MSEDLLPIGQFARLGRLSVKQLRHYDELGLLRPVRVDGDSGYRYYHPSQARTALSIGLLRSMDVPLAVIAQILTGSGPADALHEVREQLEAELARRRRTLTALERIMSEGLPSAQVSLVTEPAHRVALVREVAAGPEDIARVTSSCVSHLMSALYGCRPPQQPVRLVGLFPVDLDDVIPVSVALITEQALPGTEPGVLRGGTFAQTAHTGPYDQISLTAHALLTWCAERGHLVNGPIREVYVSDPATTSPEQLLTHLMIALREHP